MPMIELIEKLFSSDTFIHHGHCYLWQPELLLLHILSDSLIALAYYSIPLTLVYFVQKRKDLPFDWIFLLFSAFIVSCGTTHLMEIWTLWHPTYWLSWFLKAITAFISIYTAMTLVELMPLAMTLPSPAQMIKSHLEGICNYFTNRTTNATAEGINTKIKLIMRQGYGFNNFDNLKLRLLAAFDD